jgi:PAS domain S-box-containing protein
MTRVLHVENDEADLLIFKRHLSKSSIPSTLTSVRSLSEASKIISHQHFDIIFCDFNLPDGTALEFIRNNLNIEDSPVIILSSKVEVKHAVESLKLGAFDFIAKDFLSVGEIEKQITNVERRKKEDKLRDDLEKRLDENYANTRAFLDNTSDGIWSVDAKGNLLIINQVAKNNLKQHVLSPLKIGEPFFKRLDEKFRNKWLTLYNKALKGENSRSIDEYKVEDRSFVLECSCTPILSNDKINGATFFVREVTERIHQERQIRENEQNFRSIFENSDVPILVESKVDNMIIDLNEACSKLHKYQSGKMIGMSIFDTIPPDHLEASQKNYALYLKGKIDVLDSFVYTSDKQSIPVQISVAEIEFNGTPSNLIFYQDISQRKETERKLKEAKQLAEKSAEFKSQFLANMSHEIRTPLNALIGFTDILEQSELNEDQSKWINIIQKSGEDLMSIINDILDLTKIEAGKMSVNKQNFDLAELLHKVDSLYSQEAEDKNLSLEINIPSELPKIVIGDQVKISQVLNNIVSNAIKFTNKGGVTITTSFTIVSDNFITCTFEINDTGMGISKKNAAIIFDNFTQVDSSFQRKHQGTGLGLSIVKNLCDLMGGSVSVESTIHKGSTFTIDIPLEISQSTELAATVNLESLDLSSLKVMICEDHEVNILLNERVMEGLGINFCSAKNGQEGLDMFESFRPDIILMDLQMPVMDGYTATSRIREVSDVPIFAMSAHVLDEERLKCAELGMNGFISKPFKTNDLRRVFHQVTSSKNEKSISSKWNSLEMPTLINLSDGDADFVNTLFDIYLKSTGQELILMKNEKDLLSSEIIRKSAHKMKPSFITFEFIELNQKAEKIENGTATLAEINEFIIEVEGTIQHVKDKQANFNS